MWPALIAGLARALGAERRLEPDRPDAAARVRSVAVAYFEAWQARDPDAFGALLADGVSFASPSGEVTGKGSLCRGVPADE